jgi:hypothetical protein
MNRYPLPLINEMLDKIAGARYFTKLDMLESLLLSPHGTWRGVENCFSLLVWSLRIPSHAIRIDKRFWHG